MKYLGIDYGTKRIGVAVSDETGTLAFPLTTVASDREALGRVAALAKENSVAAIVLGESYNFKNERNPVMEDIDQFKKDIAQLSGLPVEYEREFFTSTQAAHQYEDTTQPRRPERVGAPTKASGEKLDASAAALILQGFLDRIKATPSKAKESP